MFDAKEARRRALPWLVECSGDSEIIVTRDKAINEEVMALDVIDACDRITALESEVERLKSLDDSAHRWRKEAERSDALSRTIAAERNDAFAEVKRLRGLVGALLDGAHERDRLRDRIAELEREVERLAKERDGFERLRMEAIDARNEIARMAAPTEALALVMMTERMLRACAWRKEPPSDRHISAHIRRLEELIVEACKLASDAADVITGDDACEVPEFKSRIASIRAEVSK